MPVSTSCLSSRLFANFHFLEFNIATDPDALAELLKSRKVPVVLAPLNVTHQAFFDEETHAQLLSP
jgi:inosine-uridine nucleoside N-ribohydrolase